MKRATSPCRGGKKIRSTAAREKIAAEEIENLLLRHPAAIHAALVSMEDSLLGEKSCAYLVVKEPLRAVAVRRFLREQGVAEFKLPDRVECVDALPLTPVGKVDKKQLRQWLAGTQAGLKEKTEWRSPNYRLTRCRSRAISRRTK
ncbi:AMP-binding enzyme [Escherichia coli]